MSFYYNKDISGCGLAGYINTDRRRESGEKIISGITILHERSNGLGGGFAAYGIYPDFKDHYAFHIMFSTAKAQEETEHYLKETLIIDKAEPIKTRPTQGITNVPILRRYFVLPKADRMQELFLNEDDYIVQCVTRINRDISGAFVVSCGQNMGAFKAVGYPEDVGRFYRLEEYEAYIWTAHGRFPTNTQGWWGGAHPFTLLDWAVVHNGEISSYGINKRYVEMFGYSCTMMTDTEVVAYVFDLLVRKHKLPLALACRIMAAPFWKDIEKMEPKERELYKTLRATYGSALLNGPFAFLLSHGGGLIGLNDRIKLRPFVAGIKDKTVYMASEESSIHEMCDKPEKIWYPTAGEPYVVNLEPEK